VTVSADAGPRGPASAETVTAATCRRLGRRSDPQRRQA